ncbi:hypothetical protein Q3G72_025090 [Acer saccharum]|nr:hypothetical protein Q3G72_025090 [Acer saccharum]
MDTKEVSGAIEDSPFGPWLLVSYGSKYGRGNGGTRNIGKAGNGGKINGGGVQAIKTGVENISIDGVLGNGNVGKSENYRSKNSKTSKNAFDKVGGSRFKVLNEEMDDIVNDVAQEQQKVGGSQERLGSKKKDVLKEITNKAGSSLSTSGGKSKQQVTQNINPVCDEDACDEVLDDSGVLQQLHKDVIASMAFDNQVEVDSNNKASKIGITYDATFEVAASNLKDAMARVIE